VIFIIENELVVCTICSELLQRSAYVFSNEFFSYCKIELDFLNVNITSVHQKITL